jgi:hypothetical protein
MAAWRTAAASSWGVGEAVVSVGTAWTGAALAGAAGEVSTDGGEAAGSAIGAAAPVEPRSAIAFA